MWLKVLVLVLWTWLIFIWALAQCLFETNKNVKINQTIRFLLFGKEFRHGCLFVIICVHSWLCLTFAIYSKLSHLFIPPLLGSHHYPWTLISQSLIKGPLTAADSRGRFWKEKPWLVVLNSFGFRSSSPVYSALLIPELVGGNNIVLFIVS